MVNVYINYEKKFAFVEFRTGKPPGDAKPEHKAFQPGSREPSLCSICTALELYRTEHCAAVSTHCHLKSPLPGPNMSENKLSSLPMQSRKPAMPWHWTASCLRA